MFDLSKSILQEIHPWFLNNTKKKLFVKRDDLIHPLVSGNKWRKLRLNVEHAMNQKFKGVLTFGGAYSNHLLASASACHLCGLESIGVVRGEELTIESNPMLLTCHELGMTFIFVSREEYSDRNEKSYLEYLHEEHPGYYLIPEGGANYLGMIGCQQILFECDVQFDSVFVAQGTTTTSCGILTSLPADVKLHVVPVLKGFDAMKEMKGLLNSTAFDQDWTADALAEVVIHEDAHFGGYGKYTSELLDFMERFHQETAVPLDPVYTGKAMYAIMNYCQNSLDHTENILFIHTGGIEGGKQISERTGRAYC